MTDETTAMITQPPSEMRMSGPRLPFHPAIEERFGIDRGTWKVLTDVIFPSAEAPESIVMALSYCKARSLDILKRPVHIVPVYDRKRAKMVDSVWPAISESRITAMRTGEYAGKDETVFGPEKTETLGGVEIAYPEWAVVTVYRFIKGVRCAFTGERVRWKEYYAKAKRDTLVPNDMWKTKTYSQISKCAEASALRTAFPEEVPADGTAEEMEGQEVASVHMDEVARPSLMARLSGNQSGAGFSHGDVVEQTATPKRRGRPPKSAQGSAVAAFGPTANPSEPETADGATEASDAPAGPHFEPGHAQPGETYLMLGDAVSGLGRLPTYIDGKLYSSAGQEGAAKLKTYARHPIATANAQAAETSQDSSGSATDASTGSAEEISSLDASNPSQHGASDPEVQDGFADLGEVYLMADTPAMADGRRVAFKDGAVVGAIDDWGLLPVYDEHPPADAEIVEGPQLPPEIATYADAVKAAADFKTVKFALSTLQKTPVWKVMTDDEADEVRFNTWDIMVNTGLADRLDPSADVSVFRLWLEWTEDPEEIEAMLSKLEDHPDFKGKGDNLKENIRGAAARRLEALSE